MSPRPFEPKFMQLSVLTAALQGLTPPPVRDRDPDQALHPSEADVPAEALLDPVAIIGYEHSFTHTVHDFLRAIAAGEPPRPSFADGVQNQRVLDAIARSASSGRWEKVQRP